MREYLKMKIANQCVQNELNKSTKANRNLLWNTHAPHSNNN